MFINRNKFFIPGEVINEIIAGAKAFCEHMKKFGILIDYRTGETADLADQVRTVTVDMSVTARIKKTDVITTERIAPGNIIVGLASHGQTEWEEEENYGPASNGFTGFRHGFLHSEYKTKFPETYAPEVTDKKYKKLIFRGKYSVEDMLIGAESLGKVLTSPTRVYAPLFKSFLDDLSPKNRKKITGIIHNSGGGQTKVLGYVQPGIKVVKNSLYNLGLIPPVFRAYQKAGKISERELHETTNVGVLKEVYFSDNGLAREFIQQSRELGIHTDVIGRVEENKNMAKKVLLIKREDNKWLSFTR
jgi:phosphoribosylformylglycinamidine cyclo-ligase